MRLAVSHWSSRSRRPSPALIVALCCVSLSSVALGDEPQAPNTEPVEVTVVGTRFAQTPGSAHLVTRKELERFEYDDPHAVLVRVPGVYVRGEDGTGLRPNIGIRGVNPDRSKKLTLLEDGILFGPAPYSAPAAYYFPLVTRMSSIRVVKGPSAIAYGPQTVGGALDFVTRPIPSDQAGGADLAVGEYGYNKLHAHFGASTDRIGFLIEGVRLQNDGFKKLPSGADTGSTRNDWMAKFSYLFDPDASTSSTLTLKLSYADEVSNETYLGLTDRDFRENPDRRYPASGLDRMQNHRTSIVLSHVLERPGVFRLQSTLYRHDLARVWRKLNRFRGAALFGVLQQAELLENQELYRVLTGESDGTGGGDDLLIGPNDRSFVSQGFSSTLSASARTAAFSHRLEAGIRLHNDEIVRRHSESGFRMQAGRLIPDGKATLTTEANTARSYALALHALDAISYRGLTLTPGVRVELIQSELLEAIEATSSDRLVLALLPGVGLYSALSPDFGLLAGIYRGFSPPPPGSQKPIESENSVNTELGARFDRDKTRAEVIGFYNAYSNLTNTCTLAGGCAESELDSQSDAGRARIYGVEVYASHLAPLGTLELPLSLSYTVTRAEFSRSFDSSDPIFSDVRQGDEVPYIPRHQLSASAGLQGVVAGGVAALNYVAAMREEPGTGPLSEALSTDSQFWVDLGAHLHPLHWLTVYGNIRNLFDAREIVSHRPYGARPSAPRWIQVGAKAGF